MLTVTVAVNLPIWRKSRLEPRVAEARAMRAKTAARADAQRLETRTGLAQQLALERATRESAALYRSTLAPQVHAAADTALHAYQLGRVDFLTLFDAQLRVYATALAEAEAIATHNKAIAEIDFLTGADTSGAAGEGALPCSRACLAGSSSWPHSRRPAAAAGRSGRPRRPLAGRAPAPGAAVPHCAAAAGRRTDSIMARYSSSPGARKPPILPWSSH